MQLFPVCYNESENIIRLDGPAGASIMLSILLKAKFGEAFDPIILFHEPLARIMLGLQERCRRAGPPIAASALIAAGPFTAEDLHRIAEAVLNESDRAAWWSMSREQRATYLRGIVAAPHTMSDAQLQAVFDNIESGLWNRRRVVEAADKAKL